jgi:hypothetical protein
MINPEKVISNQEIKESREKGIDFDLARSLKREFLNHRIVSLVKERDTCVQENKIFDPVKEEQLRDLRGLNGLPLDHPALIAYLQGQLPDIKREIEMLEHYKKIAHDRNDPHSMTVRLRNLYNPKRLEFLVRARDFLDTYSEEQKLSVLVGEIKKARQEYLQKRDELFGSKDSYREIMLQREPFERTLSQLEIQLIENLIHRFNIDLRREEGERNIDKFNNFFVQLTTVRDSIYRELYQPLLSPSGREYSWSNFYFSFDSLNRACQLADQRSLGCDNDNATFIMLVLSEQFTEDLRDAMEKRTQEPLSVHIGKIINLAREAQQEAIHLLKERHKITAIIPEIGSRFDPHICQALGHEKSEIIKKPERVARVVRSGIKQFGEVKRKAEVMVSQ